MIVVIADDLTGAAELAGIGLRYNLDVEMSTTVNSQTKADLLVISADTRSMRKDEAVSSMGTITAEAAKLHPHLIYKKIDSVLRGHVVAELQEQMKVLDEQSVLLVCANPALGRTIKNGEYFYNNEPVHLSSFANDPEFAVGSSNVLQMLRAADEFVAVRKKDDVLPPVGIIVGEVTSADDLDVWAMKVNTSFAAGAAGFFTAILDRTALVKSSFQQLVQKDFSQPALFVCGTTFAGRQNAVRLVSTQGGPVSYMPASIIESEEVKDYEYQIWADKIVFLMRNEGKAIIAIAPELTANIPTTAFSLRTRTANVIEKVFKEINVSELFIEGGSTAAAIIRKLHFETFFPVQELSPGVVRMRVKEHKDTCITVKPGSYEWPAGTWTF